MTITEMAEAAKNWRPVRRDGPLLIGIDTTYDDALDEIRVDTSRSTRL